MINLSKMLVRRTHTGYSRLLKHTQRIDRANLTRNTEISNSKFSLNNELINISLRLRIPPINHQTRQKSQFQPKILQKINIPKFDFSASLPSKLYLDWLKSSSSYTGFTSYTQNLFTRSSIFRKAQQRQFSFRGGGGGKDPFRRFRNFIYSLSYPLFYYLMVINAVIFLMCNLPIFDRQFIVRNLAMNQYNLSHGKIWTLFTSGFVHYNFFHIAFNMFTFYFFGR